ERGDVATGDQQDHPHGCQRRDQARTDVADEELARGFYARSLRLVPLFRVLELGAKSIREGSKRSVQITQGHVLRDPAYQRIDSASVLTIQLRGGPDARRRAWKPEAA